MSKNLGKNFFVVVTLKAAEEKNRIPDPVYGHKDPDPHQM
jgi:hypothetical protein